MARMYNDSLWLLVWNPIHGRKKKHSPLQSGFILSAACFSNWAILQVIHRRDFLLSWVCVQSSFQSGKGRSQEQKLKLSHTSLWGALSSKILFQGISCFWRVEDLKTWCRVEVREGYSTSNAHFPAAHLGVCRESSWSSLMGMMLTFVPIVFLKDEAGNVLWAVLKVSASLEPACLHHGEKKVHVPTWY